MLHNLHKVQIPRKQVQFKHNIVIANIEFAIMSENTGKALGYIYVLASVGHLGIKFTRLCVCIR